jgi:tRNA-specific 2-thiouridylase
MGMAHFSIDLREEFRAGVVKGWLEGHAAGLTPNPCVRCNGNVRLDAMLELAERLGAQTLATGHYARVYDGDDRIHSENGEAHLGEAQRACAEAIFDGEQPLLRVAVDEGKDQSYALAGLSPSSLARLRFPLGSLTKPMVRERAQSAGLEVAKRPDSQDLCFLAGTDTTAFLARHGGIGRRVGAIVDREGRRLGEHGGVHTVTIGQRRGLGLGGRSGGDGRPLFVIATDARTNTVTVGSREELRTETVGVRDVTLHRDAACVDGVKVRYRGRRMPCRVEGVWAAGRHEWLELSMEDAIERTAPGQVACLYAGDVIVGHGTITSSSAI